MGKVWARTQEKIEQKGINTKELAQFNKNRSCFKWTTEIGWRKIRSKERRKWVEVKTIEQ